MAGLRYDGCEVEHSADVAEAEVALGRQKFDLLVVDQRLPSDPKRGGTSFVRYLRAEDGMNKDVPFVLLTASSDPRDLELAESIPGCLDVIQKGDEKLRRIRDAVAKAFDEFVPRDERHDPSEERLFVTMRRVERLSTDDGKWAFEIDEWSDGKNSRLFVNSVELPFGVREELNRSDYDVYVEASVNLSASEAAELRPRDFRLSAGAR